MAALTRPTEATYVINEKVTVDTTDREDHSFCGIMFPIKCKDILPINQVVINSIAVRGGLGPVTVWVTNDDTTVIKTTAGIAHRHPIQVKKRSSKSSVFAPTVGQNQNGKISLKPEHWTRVYSKTHTSSFREYTSLDIESNPIVLKPNQVRGIYIHSTLDSDEAIVYDNKQKEKTYDDNFLTVLPGRAHVSAKPFGSTSIWGYGGAWRNNREFVGKISYGVVYKLWNPIEYRNFGGGKFRTIVRTMFACQRRRESTLSRLPDDVIYYILNMCRWDWVGDGYTDCLEYKKRCRRESNERNVATLTDGDGGGKQSVGVARTANSGNSCDDDDAGSCGQSNHSSASTRDDEDDDSDDSDSDSDMDTTYDHGDHSSGNAFHFQNVDELVSSDEENAAEQDRFRDEGRRRWLRNNHRYIFQQLMGGGMQNDIMAGGDDDDDDESN